MISLPASLGKRPRLGVEVRPEGIVAARAAEDSSLLSAVSRVELGPDTAVPQLRPPAHGAHEARYSSLSSAERGLLTAAVRSALETVAGRERETTLIIPDAAVRVLLLDFDALPAKPVEALPVVRFRLKKLVPFDVEAAAVSYQVLSATRGEVRVLAVAIPRELLLEYEGLVRDAGFEPGAVLPSTLAALAAVPASSDPVLLVNAGQHGVTTAIVQGEMLLLHRSIELAATAQAPAFSSVPGDPDPVAAAARIQTTQLEREFAAIDRARENEWELAQAVSVAVAYYEDTVSRLPRELLVAGTVPAKTLSGMLDQAGVGPVAVAEVISRGSLSAELSGARVPTGWLAGVQGALSS